MFDYAQSAQDALDLLTEFGAVITVSWTPAPTSDAPDAPQPAPVTARAFGVVLEYSANKMGTQADALIRQGDRQLLLAVVDENGAAMPEPALEALVTDAGGVRYRVKNVAPLAPAGVPVLFDVNLRR